MRILVTGAGGFIGRATVAAAVARGHHVRALLRPGSCSPDWTAGAEMSGGSAGPGVEVARADLLDPDSIRDVVHGVDVVIHLAAAMQGDAAAQMATTVGGTAHLLDAMVAAGVPRMVAISSTAVYDVCEGAPLVSVDESCMLESCPDERDAYCKAKLAQETLIRDFAARQGLDVLMLRPGAVYGRERLWSPRIGLRLTPRIWVIPRAGAPLPVTFVHNCADAIVLAAERSEVNGIAMNVVDDDVPTRLEYARRVRNLITPRPWLLVLPAFPVRIGGALVHGLARILRGKRPTSGQFSRRRFAARFTPRPFSNARIRDRLGWSPRETLDAAFSRLEGQSVVVR